ncbi:MAG: hypothetical protein KC416_17775, partial [Myxococcales bacterium]|nr:hypothetical protein [Myxococcales bacterium]
MGDDLTPEAGPIEATISTDGSVPSLHAWLNDDYLGPLPRSAEGASFLLRIETAGLPPGHHLVTLAVDADAPALHGLRVTRTRPLYVVVSNDWDTSDNKPEQYRMQEELHERHPELLLTHFVGPYVYTDPAVTEVRRDWITDWLLGMRDDHGDEIGVHIHSYCSFIESAGIPCRTGPVYAENWGRPEGYTVLTSAYTEDEFTTILDRADEIF